jgi:hypothetical protein
MRTLLAAFAISIACGPAFAQAPADAMYARPGTLIQLDRKRMVAQFAPGAVSLFAQEKPSVESRRAAQNALFSEFRETRLKAESDTRHFGRRLPVQRQARRTRRFLRFHALY